MRHPGRCFDSGERGLSCRDLGCSGPGHRGDHRETSSLSTSYWCPTVTADAVQFRKIRCCPLGFSSAEDVCTGLSRVLTQLDQIQCLRVSDPNLYRAAITTQANTSLEISDAFFASYGCTQVAEAWGKNERNRLYHLVASRARAQGPPAQVRGSDPQRTSAIPKRRP